jgi:hypothetical protein
MNFFGERQMKIKFGFLAVSLLALVGMVATNAWADDISNINLSSADTGAWSTGVAGYAGAYVATAPKNGNTGTGITFANWNGNYVEVTQGSTTTINFTPITLGSDPVVNSLLNNFWGGSNTQAVITFTNSDDATAVYSLVGGQTVRDYNEWTWINTLTGSNSAPGLGSVTAQEWWNNNGSGQYQYASGQYQRLDVQSFVLPASWNGSELDSITIANPDNSSGSDVLSALQVNGISGTSAATPEPSSLLLLASGLAGLAGMARRKIGLRA